MSDKNKVYKILREYRKDIACGLKDAETRLDNCSVYTNIGMLAECNANVAKEKLLVIVLDNLTSDIKKALSKRTN